MFKRIPTARRFLVIYGVAILLAIVVLFLPRQAQFLIFALTFLCAFLVIVVPRVMRRMPGWMAYLRDNVDALPKMSAGIALVMLCVSGWFYQPEYIVRFYGFYLFALSLPFLWFGRSAFRFDPIPYDIPQTDANQRVRWWGLALSLSSFALLMTINIKPENKSALHEALGLIAVPSHSQMALLCLGLAGLMIGFRAKLLPKIEWRRYHWILLACVLLGGGVRAWDLEYTLHLFVDELFFLNDVIDIRDEMPPLLLPDNAPSTDVYSFFQIIVVTILGPSLTSLRLVSPLISMIGLVVVYAFARQLFTVRVALLSVFLFAVMPVHIQFGRIGMNMIVDPIFGMLGFVYLIRGMRSRHIGDFALVGVMFGMTHYFYEGGRLFFTLFLVMFLVWMVLFGRRDPLFRLPHWRGWLAMIFCLLVVITPIYHTRFAFDYTLTERLNATRTPNFLITDRISEFLLTNEIGYIGAPLHRYVHDVSRDNFFRSDFAYVLPILVPFFLIGFGLLVFQLHRIRGALLIWWIMGVYMGNSLITDFLSAPSPRYIVTYAVLMVIVAVGMDRAWQFLEQKLARFKRVIVVLFIAYLAYVGVFEVHHYFQDTVGYYYAHVHGKWRTRPAWDDMILRAVDLPENYSLQVLSNALFPITHYDVIPRFYLRDDLDVDFSELYNFDDVYLSKLTRGVDYVFAFTRGTQDQVLPLIEKHFLITRIEGSPYDIDPNAEMLFAYAPVSDNPAPERIEMEFERAPDAKP